MNDEKILIKQPFVMPVGFIAFFGMLLSLCFFLLCAVSSIPINDEGKALVIGVAIAGMLLFSWLIYLLYQNKYVEVVVTDKRVYVTNTKTGKSRNEVTFEKITNIVRKGVDSIEILTSSGITGTIPIFCENRDQVFETISEQLVKVQSRHIVIEKDLPNDSPKDNTSETDKIREYKKLLDEGIITQEEFDAKKKELLKL